MSALRNRSAPNYVLVGWLVVIAAVVFTYAAFTKSIPFKPKYEVEAVVSSSNQLR